MNTRVYGSHKEIELGVSPLDQCMGRAMEERERQGEDDWERRRWSLGVGIQLLAV